MITEKRLEESLKFLSDTDEENAKANAQVKYLDRLLKRKKALHIAGNSVDKSVSAKEQAYYGSDTYKEAIRNYLMQRLKQAHLKTKEIKKDLLSIYSEH